MISTRARSQHTTLSQVALDQVAQAPRWWLIPWAFASIAQYKSRACTWPSMVACVASAPSAGTGISGKFI